MRCWAEARAATRKRSSHSCRSPRCARESISRERAWTRLRSPSSPIPSAPAARELLQDGKIDMGHARALLALAKARQVELAHQVAARGLSVRETERLVQQATAPVPARATKPRLDADGTRLQEELAESLGAT